MRYRKAAPARSKIHRAEIHWYEAHGIGKVQQKVKELL